MIYWKPFVETNIYHIVAKLHKTWVQKDVVMKSSIAIADPRSFDIYDSFFNYNWNGSKPKKQSLIFQYIVSFLKCIADYQVCSSSFFPTGKACHRTSQKPQEIYIDWAFSLVRTRSINNLCLLVLTMLFLFC